MSETTPDPADVHTGTDRAELTDAERAILRGVLHEFKSRTCDDDCSNDTYAAVESIVAARLAALTAERDQWKFRAEIRSDLAPMMAEERDAARAELAAANARCSEAQALAFKWLDYGEDTVEYRLGETLHSALSTPASPVTNAACDPTICCGAGTDCAAFAELHAEVEKWRTKYQQMMVSPRAEADELARRVDAGQKMEDTALDRASELRSENAALQATLDRVTAAFDRFLALPHDYSSTFKGELHLLIPDRELRDLRAALTPEGTE